MNKKKAIIPIIIIAVIIIPVLYSFFYLKAFWNPYGSLNDMKVAIINLDKGNEKENLGNDLVNKLKDKDTMNFIVLNDSNQAQKGLVEQEYYATITIPKDFTKDLNNAENTDRKVTTITYSPNQKSNYLASQIINKVVSEVEKELRSEVSKEVVKKLSEKLEEVPDKMNDISEGAYKLQDGSTSLENGLKELKQGTSDLNTNYKKFDKGIDSAYFGSKELTKGLKDLTSGAEQINNGTKQLAKATNNIESVTKGISKLSTGANQLDKGVNAYVDGVNQAVSSINNITKQMQTIGENLQIYALSHPEALKDKNFVRVINELQKISNLTGSSQSLVVLKSKGNELKKGSNNLNTGIQTFANKTGELNKLTTGAETLEIGMAKLIQGINSTRQGSNELQNGLKELSKNSKTIKNGTEELNDGTAKALSGSKTLVKGTNTFKKEITQGTEDAKEQLKNLEGLEEYTSNPIEIEEIDYAQVDSYGVGFAPYFMSISLWVGALIMLIIFYYDPEDRFRLLGRNAKNKYLRSGLYFIIAVTQGIVLGFILKAGLGFSVTNIGLYYGTCILTSIVFFSILQFLVIKLGDIGKFLGILLLVLQLAASGGTFPIETVPSFFQSIYKFMPMNYTIRLMKEALITIDNNMVLNNVVVLIGIFVAFMVITIAIDYIKEKSEKKQVISKKSIYKK